MSEEQKKASTEEKQPKADKPTVEKDQNEQEDDFQEIISDHYELLYIMPMSYTEEELKPINEKASNVIKDNDGKITREESLGKLKFSYPIDHQSHGHYQLYEFDMPKENLQNLNKALQLTSEIVRFLIVKKKLKTKEDIAQEKALQEKLTKRKEKEIDKIKEEKKEVKETPAKKAEKKKVSLEDLDKKLDEILDTDDIV